MWEALLSATSTIAPERRDAIRLANLAIAVQIATRRGFIASASQRDGRALEAAVHGLKAAPLLLVEASHPAWQAVADAAKDAASQFSRRRGTDLWVQAFQASDSVRKSRGAYATPRALARPMAQLLLKQTDLPARIIDPAAGPGGLLLAVLEELCRLEPRTSIAVHARRLHGVELDPVARELCCLLVWLATNQELPLEEVHQRVVTDNAITRNWFEHEPYDALVMNPPWDSLRHEGDTTDEGLGRAETLRRLATELPGAPNLPPLYSGHGRGDRNLYKAFVELAPHLVRPGGRIVLLLPGAWSSDLGTRELRRRYLGSIAIDRWTSFENLRGYFPIDGRYKFGVLVGDRDDSGTRVVATRAHAADAKDVFRRHVKLRRADLAELGGSAQAIPEITTSSEMRRMLKFKRQGEPFFSGNGPLGTVTYVREIDVTVDRKAGVFERTEDLAATNLGDGTWLGADGGVLVPLVEGRMVGQYDFHQKSWIAGSGRTAQWTYANGSRLHDCTPQYLIRRTDDRPNRIAVCDVTSATNTRTVLATWVPPAWRCGNTAPVLVFGSERQALAALAVLNTMVFDWLARRVVAGLHLNRFYLHDLVWPLLTENEVSELAGAAAELQALSPRYGDLGKQQVRYEASSRGYVAAHAFIEWTVARGFRLTADDLAAIYSPHTGDRRGFWRHFGTDPHSRPIAEAALGALRSSRAGEPVTFRN